MALARCRVSLRSCRNAVQLTHPNPFPTSPQHSFVAFPQAISSWQGVYDSLILKISKFLGNFLNLELHFSNGSLTIAHHLLDYVLLSSLTVDDLSTLLNSLKCGDSFNSQLAANILEFIKLLATLLLVLLGTSSALLEILQFGGSGDLYHQQHGLKR